MGAFREIPELWAAPVSGQKDEQYWRERADDAKRRAGSLTSYETRAELLALALQYERLAQEAAERSERGQPAQDDFGG
jgi:hypothetical protein